MTNIYDYNGTLQGRIVDLLLERLGAHIAPWLAEEIAEEIVSYITGE
jgi:hypothetical protein